MASPRSRRLGWLCTGWESATRAADYVLWRVARERRRPFDGAEVILSRPRFHAPMHGTTESAEVDCHFREYLATQSERECFFETVGPAVLEPRYGFVFLSPLRVVLESLNRKDHRWATVRPSITGLLRMSNGRSSAKVIDLDAAISLRDLNEYNFWHAVDDVFSKLVLADEAGIPRDIPAVLGQRATTLRWFPEIERAFNSFRPVIVQDHDTYVRAEKIYCGVVLKNDASYFDRFMDVVDECVIPMIESGAATAQNPVPYPTAVFVTRAPRRWRRVANAEDVHDVCRSKGLDVIDFDETTFAEARERMLAAETIVGFHGAGLTNMMHRRGLPTRVGEILMEDHVAAEYFMLARHWGFAYRAMIGRRVGESGGRGVYEVDCDVLATFIDDVLAMPVTATPRVAET